MDKTTVVFGDCVEIIRCQARVIRKLRTRSGIWNPGVSAGLSALELPDNRMLCPVVRVDDIDPHTDFVRIGDVPDVEIRLTDRKYLLRRNDIIMGYTGYITKIGKVGFIDRESLAIPGNNLLILRAASLDPVWLFHFLRRNAVRSQIISPLMARIPEILDRRGNCRRFRRENSSEERIRAENGAELPDNAETKKMISQQVFSLGIEDLRAMRFAMPDNDEIAAVNEIHSQIAKEVEKIRHANTEAELLERKLEMLFELAHNHSRSFLAD